MPPAFLPPLALASLILPPVVALLGSAAHAERAYPTDRCLSRKAQAAARYCSVAFRAAARGEAVPARADRFLERSWRSAEDHAAADGVDCRQTSESAATVADLIAGEAAAMRDELAASNDGRCLARQLRQEGRLCRALLAEEARELAQRHRLGVDSGSSPPAFLLQDDSQDDRFRRSRRETGCGGVLEARAAGAEGEAGAEALAKKVTQAITVAPGIPTEWTAVLFDEGERVEYAGRTWEPACWDGSPYRIYVKRGTVNKLLMYYQGGGACWDYFTCQAVGTFKDFTDERDDPTRFDSGFADLSNAANPFRDWHAVFVPYCTGDIHWGDNDATYQAETSQGDTVSVEVRHRGHHNARVAEKWAREHFAMPEQVFVTGSSAGAYGAIANAAWLTEKVYPSADMAVLGDAGNGVVTQDFLSVDIANWGIDTVLPDWIDKLNVPLTELDAADLYIASAEVYPRNRVATYTTAFDGSGGGQSAFYNIMLNPVRSIADVGNILGRWPNWWEGSCAWNQGMRELNAKAATQAENFRFYVGSGSRHTMWGSDKVYTDTTGGVPTIVDWIDAMLDDTADWQNVECTNCGLLLEGDPAPDPLEPPFTRVGPDVVIDCPGTP